MKKLSYVLLLAVIVLASCRKNEDPGFPVLKQDSRMITDWIGLQLRLIRNTSGVTHIAFSRHFSYTGVALYESLVKGAPFYRSVSDRLNGNPSFPVLSTKKEIYHPVSANVAMAEMMRYFYNSNPANLTLIDSLEDAWHSRFIAVAPAGIRFDASLDYGRDLASAVIEWSKQDGSVDANIPYSLLGEGFWEKTPVAFAAANMPGWGNNRPMIPGSLNGTMPAPPPAFSKEPGSAFYNSVKEVWEISKTLTGAQKEVALFWDDAPNGKYVSVFGHWFGILKQVLEKEKTPLMEGALAYLRLGISMNDATISCWKAKYLYNTLRPVSYIRNYLGDGEWNSLIGTPPHPEYSSAHSTISASCSYALETVFGKKYSFTDHTYDVIGLNPRTFSGFDQAAKEAGDSRLYAGIHYRYSIAAGYEQGRKVAANVIHALKIK